MLEDDGFARRPAQRRVVRPEEDAFSNAAYRTSGLDADWLGELAERSVPALGARAGVYAYTYRIEAGGTIVLGGVADCEAGDDYWQALSRWGADNTQSIARLYRTQVLTLGRALRNARSMQLPLSDPSAAFRRHGVRDILVVMGQDRTNSGLILAAPARGTVDLSNDEHGRLQRLASELAVAHRARRLAQHAEASLSGREREVARAIQRGAGDKAIADELGVSLSSVAQYKTRLRGKLGCLPGEELLALQRVAGAGLERRSRSLEPLTPAEHSVAALLVSGLSHVEIARQRGSSARTVASQLAAVFRKTGVSGRRELVARWFGEGK